MKFRTPISIDKFDRQISYEAPILMLGSCFTESIGEYLRKYMFDININPFGVIYNPLSIKRAVDALIHRGSYSEEDLGHFNDLWFSFDHYTKYSGTDQQKVLDKINNDFLAASEVLKSAAFLVITMGTAWVYRYRKSGQIVNNCHKIPAAEFERFLLSPKQLIRSMEEMIEELLQHNPGLQIIFTVSPVRHLKDGMTGNQRSKSILIQSAHELTCSFPNNTAYFPAYEIVLDDLRDYRFFESDLVHPNTQAVEYIWELFSGSVIREDARQIMMELDPYLKLKTHRPLHTDTPAFMKQQEDLKNSAREISRKYPFLKWPE